MNPYKMAWLEGTDAVTIRSRQLFEKAGKKLKPHVSQKHARAITREIARQKTEAAGLSAAYAMSKQMAQSTIKGRGGMVLRFGGKVGLRAVPVVGALMMAHDVYRAGRYVYEQF